MPFLKKASSTLFIRRINTNEYACMRINTEHEFMKFIMNNLPYSMTMS